MKMSPFVKIRRDLHRIPELGFQEHKTQKYVLDYIYALPQQQSIEVKLWRTGILVRVEGRSATKTIGYRADMDGLPIHEQTTYGFQSEHPGHMHACGHDIHMSVALGLLTHFAANPVDDHVLFIFQPAEEGPGGALPMRESEVFKAWQPDTIIALHIAPEYPVGTIATKEGLLFANTSELFVDFHGKGGHAAFPHLTEDMVVAASHFITQVQSVVSRNVNPLDAAVITVGKVEAGTKQNIIADHARLEGTMRTLSLEAMKMLKQRVESLLTGIETGFNCRTSIDYGANYCQVYNDHDATSEFMDWARQANYHLVHSDQAMTGEDFGYFLQEIPGFMFWLGVETPYGLHHAQIEPNEQAIDHAIMLLTEYISWKGSQ